MANYTVDFPDNTNFNVSVPFGETASITSWISASFSPASAISAVELTNVILIGENERWGEVFTDQGEFPIKLINDGTGSSQIIYVSASYDNTLNVNDLIDTGLGYQYWLNVAELSAGSDDVLEYPASAAHATSDGFSGALSAAGAQVTDYFTPTVVISGTVPYNTVSNTFYGTATYTTSSLLGDNTVVDGIAFNIYLSGADVSNFTAVSSNVTIPGTASVGVPITFSTTFDNTYLHAEDETFTVVAVISTGSTQLSGDGWFGSFVPLSDEFVSSTQTIGACGDAGAPSGVTGFTAIEGQTRIGLTWTNPSDTDLSATQVQYAIGTVAPSAHTEGTTLYAAYTAPGAVASTVHTGLTADQAMAYSVWTVDTVNEWSTAVVSASATPFAVNIYGTNAFPYFTDAQIRSVFVDEGII